MMARRAGRCVLMWLIAAALALPGVLLSLAPAVSGAETVCQPSTVLKYDDGTATEYVSTPCAPCSNVQGVRFSLPSGVFSAAVSSVTFWCRPAFAGASAEVWIMGADRATELVPPFAQAVGGTGWQTARPPSEVVVSGDFYVFVRRVDKGTDLGHDYWNDEQRSFVGEHPSTAKEWEGRGDIMVRATIEASAHVGAGQRYSSIQAAIDEACTGLTIHVHPGTYNENVTVWKKVSISSTGGAGQTTVQTPSSRRSAFTVTAPGVSLSGMTIRGATDADRAGVSLENVSGCTVSGNVIMNNDLGVYLSEGSTGNVIVDNEFKSNTSGVLVDGRGNHITGNSFHGNTAPLGAAVFLSARASGNELRFNSLTLDPGAAGTAHVYNQNTSEEVVATQNWWGDAGGPANAGGQGPAVGEGVVYEPWLGAAPSGVKTFTASAGEFTITAREEASAAVLGKAVAAAAVSVCGFSENPAGELPAAAMGKWLDVLVADGGAVESLEIRIFYTAQEKGSADEASLRLYWWNGSAWKLCSDSGVDQAGGFVWARLDGNGSPTVGDLQGTFFGVGTSGGGSSWWLIPVVILTVVVLLVAFRVFWVMVVRNGRALIV